MALAGLIADGYDDAHASSIPLIATYHPSYLLRTPGDVRKCWEDLQLLRRTFDATEA